MHRCYVVATASSLEKKNGMWYDRFESVMPSKDFHTKICKYPFRGGAVFYSLLARCYGIGVNANLRFSKIYSTNGLYVQKTLVQIFA